MTILVVQIVIQQWDKGQRSEADLKARAEKPDRLPVKQPNARYLADHQVLLDQHGDDVMGAQPSIKRDVTRSPVTFTAVLDISRIRSTPIIRAIPLGEWSA